MPRLPFHGARGWLDRSALSPVRAQSTESELRPDLLGTEARGIGPLENNSYREFRYSAGSLLLACVELNANVLGFRPGLCKGREDAPPHALGFYHRAHWERVFGCGARLRFTLAHRIATRLQPPFAIYFPPTTLRSLLPSNAGFAAAAVAIAAGALPVAVVTSALCELSNRSRQALARVSRKAARRGSRTSFQEPGLSRRGRLPLHRPKLFCVRSASQPKRSRQKEKRRLKPGWPHENGVVLSSIVGCRYAPTIEGSETAGTSQEPRIFRCCA